ncbi:hypothetical protein E2562_001153 [Oryza meyeriana var. granulata]|uniref:K+ potassium transporter integral membrane domain-containing protein n=1 Tax=Oryza meyeriana var. granulata TaxID=110450 RepID=A0A6G1EDV4_9ORYZ|nr:hypothetical protein E2562_001153 [Oryza meyeriana var. granulata]
MSDANGEGGSVLPGPPLPMPSNHYALPSFGAAGPRRRYRLSFRSILPAARARFLTPPATWGNSTSRDTPSPPNCCPLCSARHVSNLLTLGFSEEEQEAECADDPALVFDADDKGEMDALPATAEYARRMRDVGMQVVAMMSRCPEAGFGEEPFAEGRRKARCLMWVSKVMDDGVVLRAFNPKYILDYFRRNGHHGWVSLGGVLLCYTGTEALFASYSEQVAILVIFLLAPSLLPPKTLPAISDADESEDLALFRRAILSSAMSYFFRSRLAPKVALL